MKDWVVEAGIEWRSRTCFRRRHLRRSTRSQKSMLLLSRCEFEKESILLFKFETLKFSLRPVFARGCASDSADWPRQDGVSWIWSSDMDHQLSLFVRKYCFDFSKASKALRSYVQHVSFLPHTAR